MLILLLMTEKMKIEWMFRDEAVDETVICHPILVCIIINPVDTSLHYTISYSACCVVELVNWCLNNGDSPAATHYTRHSRDTCYFTEFDSYLYITTAYSKVWINRVRLSIVLAVIRRRNSLYVWSTGYC